MSDLGHLKLNRVYKLTVQGHTRKYEIRDPYTLVFDAKRENFASQNTCEVTIYGLSRQVRDDIIYDQNERRDLFPITLAVGYENQPSIPVIFSGHAFVGYQSRSGPDVMSMIQALDGYGVLNSVIDPPMTTNVSWNFETTMKQVMGRLKGVKPGTVQFDPAMPVQTKAATFSGYAWEVLQQYMPENSQLFVDNGVANMIGQNVALVNRSGVSVITASNGLLDVPRRTGSLVYLSMLLEPGLQIGQSLTLSVNSAPWAQGVRYKVVGLHHHGTISRVQGGTCVTDVTLLSMNSLVGVGAK